MYYQSIISQALLLLSTVALATPHEDVHAGFTNHLGKRNGANAVVTNSRALTYYQASPTTGTAGVNPPNAYTCYSGPASNFPKIGTWCNYNTMWSRAVQYALGPVGDSATEQQTMRNEIARVSQTAKVDQRVILAVILLESTGNVRVGCTNNGVENCGLMQSYNGTSFNPKTPTRSILQMIIDGTQGTAYGPGLVQLLNDANGTPKLSGGNLWKALREYNSGTVNSTNLSESYGATNSYVSNIANFLLGSNLYGNPAANCNFSN